MSLSGRQIPRPLKPLLARDLPLTVAMMCIPDVARERLLAAQDPTLRLADWRTAQLNRTCARLAHVNDTEAPPVRPPGNWQVSVYVTLPMMPPPSDPQLGRLMPVQPSPGLPPLAAHAVALGAFHWSASAVFQ